MNDISISSHMKAATLWERPLTGPDKTLTNRSGQDIDEWWGLIDRVIDIATAQSWSKAEVARRIGMADGTFSGWFSGKYTGRLDNQNKQIGQWLNSIEEMAGITASIPTSPAFLQTKSSMDIMETLAWAQAASDMVMITFNAGMGKTETCRHYRATRPHVCHITMSPHTKTVHSMLVELAAELDVMVLNPAKLVRAIGKRLERTGGGMLLIVDEAQNLQDDAINQLRHFVDNYKCGVALVGNNEIFGRFSKRTDGPSYAQLKSRLGKRLKREKPRAEDLQVFINAWGVTEPECVKFLTGIGMKGGALRQIDKTMKLATMISRGSNQPISFDHIQAAWKNRDVEDLA